MRPLLVAGLALALALLAPWSAATGGEVGADATCWNLFHEGAWHRLCYASTTQRSSGRDCAPVGDFQVCVAGTHQTFVACAIPTSPFQVTCTTRYLGIAVGNGTLPGTATAQAETWGDASGCSWPDPWRASPFSCAAATLTMRTVTVAKGSCVDAPRAVWSGHAASWLLGERPVATGPLEAWSTTCAW